MARMSPAGRRAAIVDAALAVMVRKGIASTTVRDVAEEMGTSSGLVHHYFTSMDDLLAAAFELAAAADLELIRTAMGRAGDAVAQLRVFFRTYTRAEQDWAFQLWLDAWAEATRRPAIGATSQRLNVAWQQLLATAIRSGVGEGALSCPDPDGAAWRILSLLDGLALQALAHRATITPEQVISWSAGFAETELALPVGTLLTGGGYGIPGHGPGNLPDRAREAGPAGGGGRGGGRAATAGPDRRLRARAGDLPPGPGPGAADQETVRRVQKSDDRFRWVR